MAKKVLITEDSPIVLNVHSTLLKSVGYDVSEAEDNLIALEKAKSEDFDLIVLDINTPKMDGYTFCKEIRALPKYKDVPILVITTESDPEDKVKGLEAGADLFLVKPVKTEDFIAYAKKLLGA
jgi:two-component system, chemotaxis family, chemotaxis protein CheY